MRIAANPGINEQFSELSIRRSSKLPMKVLAITPGYLPSLGGIEIFVDSLAQSLRDRSVETVVVTLRRDRLPECDNINDTVVHRLDFMRAMKWGDPTAPLGVLHKLFQIVDAEKPDVIHMHSPYSGAPWYVHRLFKKLSSKLAFIFTAHGVMKPIESPRLVRDLLLNADALTGVSWAALRSAVRLSNRIAFSSVIYNGVRELDRTGCLDHQESRSRLICVGRLETEKGFDVAIAALAKVHSEGLNAELMVIGDGGERESLKQAAIRHKVADHVHFQGALDNHRTRAAIAASSLVLVPSRMEGFSLVAAEAAFSGIPCVASRVGGLTETVEHGVSGLLVAPDNPGDLASAIIALLRDEQRARALSANSYEIARKKFNMDTCAEAYVELYRTVTHRKSEQEASAACAM